MASMVALGRLGRPQGVKGELRFIPYNPDSTVLESWVEAQLRDGRAVAIESLCLQGRHWVMKISGIEDRDAASQLTHEELLVPREQLPALGEGHYLVDLVGLAVFDPQGRLLGEVAGIEPTGGADLLVVRRGPHEWLLPAVDRFLVEVDRGAGRIVVQVPEGLTSLEGEE